MNKMRAVSKLTFKTFVGQPVGLIMGFIAPAVLTIVLPYLFEPVMHQSLEKILTLFIPGMILMPALMIGIIGTALTYSTLKESMILKKINVAGIKSRVFISSFLITFLIMILISSIWVYTLSKIIWQGKSPDPLTAAIIIPWFATSIICILIGMLISNFTKSQATAFAMSIAVFLPTIFLTGVLFTEMEGTISKIAKLLPQNSTVQLFKKMFVFSGFDLSDQVKETNHIIHFQVINSSSAKPDTVFAYIYPMALSIAQFGVLIKKMNWE